MLLVDGHVHIHDCFDLAAFLDAAYLNFFNRAICMETDVFSGVLLLTETVGDNWFRRLKRHSVEREGVIEGNQNGWSFFATREECSLVAQSRMGKKILIIAGRQIVTLENLEVLALGTLSRLNEGEPVHRVIEKIRSVDALPVIPWGFGKWWGRRGKIVKEILRSHKGSPLFLGDNGNRPGLLPPPSFFASAESVEIRILPGSDPLPFPKEMNRVGRFGFSVDGELIGDCPMAELKRLIVRKDTELKRFGDLEKPLNFLRNQITMQVKKRFTWRGLP